MTAAVRRRLHNLRARVRSLAATISATWNGGRRADDYLIEMEAVNENELRDM
jgi:hypothetical protein